MVSIKRSIFCWAVLPMTAVIMVGCNPTEGKPTNKVRLESVEPIDASSNIYQLSANDEGRFVQIFTQESWHLTLTYPNPSDNYWCTISRPSGSGNGKVRLSYDQNAGAARTAILTVRFDSEEIVLTITQLGGEAVQQLDGWFEIPSIPSTLPSSYYLVTHFVPDRLGVRNYTVLYNATTHLAVWVAYPMHKTYEGGSGRSDEWGYDPDVPTSQQFNVTQTFGGGWARGHILPSGSRDATVAMNIQTFYSTNLAPQAYDFNGQVWANLENYERSWEGTGADTLYSVTGVLPKRVDQSDTGYGTVSKGGITVTVPKYFFKALMKVTRSSGTTKYRAIAFWFENSNSNSDRSVAPSDAISVRELETRTGLNFFANIPQSIQDEIEVTEYNSTDWRL